MKILMISNTFTPHLGGVARSVETFTREYRNQGHRVIVVAPEFENMPEKEEDVIRVAAIQRFNGSDFSARFTFPVEVASRLEAFHPDIIHSHHPFLLGDTALLLSGAQDLPLVFTHHTLYEHYTHYIPVDSPLMKRFVVQLSTGYANHCDLVLAPSFSVASLLKKRGVTTPVEVVPTGIDTRKFAAGEGGRFRRELRIPETAFVVGHLGRLAPEKNLDFLSRAVAAFLKKNSRACFLVAGEGPCKFQMQEFFRDQGLAPQLRFAGALRGQALVDAYHAMNVFAFASQSETQGMVLAEAMAAGVPIVALDAPGVRDTVADGRNGCLLEGENMESFAAALGETASLPADRIRVLKETLRRDAEKFSSQRCAIRALTHYLALCKRGPISAKDVENSLWRTALRALETEWEIWANRVQALGTAIQPSGTPPSGHVS